MQRIRLHAPVASFRCPLARKLGGSRSRFREHQTANDRRKLWQICLSAGHTTKILCCWKDVIHWLSRT